MKLNFECHSESALKKRHDSTNKFESSSRAQHRKTSQKSIDCLRPKQLKLVRAREEKKNSNKIHEIFRDFLDFLNYFAFDIS